MKTSTNNISFAALASLALTISACSAANASASALPSALAPAPTAATVASIPAPSALRAVPIVFDAPTAIAGKHRSRTVDGELFAQCRTWV